MILLITLCDLFWLLWALPLLLGMLMWWLGNNKYNGMVTEYEGKLKGLNGRINGLQGDLSECGSKRANLEGDLALTKGRMREMESDMKSLKAAAESSNDGNVHSHKDEKGKGNEKGGDSAKVESNDSADNNKDNDDTGSNISAMTSAAESSIKGSDLGDITSSLAGAAAGAGLTSSDDSSSTDSGDSSSKKSSGVKSVYSKIKDDNFQIIEGIGPKMESVLKENGVSTISELAGKSPSELQGILGKYGDKYKIIDPTTWAQQAGYAAKGDFDGLIDLQKRLDTGVDNAVGMTDSKLEKHLIKTGAIKSFKQDDLKAIEGIGPATEKLLHENGIKTWRELANTDASKVKEILTAAGSRFALGDPTTWPKQAEMAADGKFDELKEYQDFLDGGRG